MARVLGILLMGFGGLMWLVALFGLASPNQKFSSAFILFLMGAPFIASGFYLFKRLATKMLAKESILNELPEIMNADYKHVIGDSAIALNKSTQTLFLANGSTRKTYSFQDVRNWNYAVLAGGASLGGRFEKGVVGQIQAFTTAKEYVRNAKNIAAGSGLFIEVKDIDHPKWRIEFARSNLMEAELLRWMEILRQNINES